MSPVLCEIPSPVGVMLSIYWCQRVSKIKHAFWSGVLNVTIKRFNSAFPFINVSTCFRYKMIIASRFRRGFFGTTKKKPVRTAVAYVISLAVGILLLKRLSQRGKSSFQGNLLIVAVFNFTNGSQKTDRLLNRNQTKFGSLFTMEQIVVDIKCYKMV